MRTGEVFALTWEDIDLERGLKGSSIENISVKEYKKITSNLEKELSKKESNLNQSITNLEEHLKLINPLCLIKNQSK